MDQLFAEAQDRAEISLRQLASIAAPALWFSPDEPLRHVGRPVPMPLPPETATAKQPVVYYVIREVALKTKANDPKRKFRASDQQFADRPWRCEAAAGSSDYTVDDLLGVKIRYLYYYEQDLGLGHHEHDLEATEMKIMVRHTPEGAVFELVTVASSAHGVGWYTNVLSVNPDDGGLDGSNDALLPMTLLVEEGKHATVPDRNGDGVYSPGYDVNYHINDAWGIRDAMRNQHLSGAAFRADMAKRRFESGKLYPPADDRRVVLETDYFQRTWLRLREASTVVNDAAVSERSQFVQRHLTDAPRYQLVGAGGFVDAQGKVVGLGQPAATLCQNGEVATTTPFGDGTGLKRLQGFLNKMGFCAEPEVEHNNRFENAMRQVFRKKFQGPYGGGFTSATERLNVSFRWQGAQRQLTITSPFGIEAPGVRGWLVPKFAVDLPRRAHADEPDQPLGRGHWGWEVLYTPSGSRVADFYVAAGRERVNYPDRRRWHSVQEVGFRMRFRKEPAPFLGFRVGVRTNAFDGFSRTRAMLEVGLGPW